jgi:hypothetical protein
MFNWFRNKFFTNEGWFGTKNEQAVGATLRETNTMKAFIENTANGRVALKELSTGATIYTYARTRDAKRGATRRGLTLIEA